MEVLVAARMTFMTYLDGCFKGANVKLNSIYDCPCISYGLQKLMKQVEIGLPHGFDGEYLFEFGIMI